MSATAMMNLRGANATDAKPVPGRITGRGHRRPRLSRVAIVTLSSAGLKYPGGWGWGCAPMLSARSRRAIGLRAWCNDTWPYKQASV
jgi:hypothetical protein